jgi:hypothetical protein
MRKLVFVAAALALVACGKKEEQKGQDDVGAPQPQVTESAPVVYDAVSKTAMAFTGNIKVVRISPVAPNDTPSLRITGDTGLELETDWTAEAKGSDSIGITPWTSLMPIPPDAKIEVHTVQRQTIGPNAQNGAFCNKTSMLAIATYTKDGQDDMQIAAFSDENWPPARAPRLCGTFTYTLHK